MQCACCRMCDFHCIDLFLVVVVIFSIFFVSISVVVIIFDVFVVSILVVVITFVVFVVSISDGTYKDACYQVSYVSTP